MWSNALKPLILMQLKDKVDFSYLKSKKETIRKVGLSLLGFVVVTAFIFVLFYISKILHLFHIVSIVPVSVVVVVFTIMQLLSIVSCTFRLMNNLYFSKDNQFLLTMPVTTNQLFISKIIVFFLYELIKNLYFFMPLFLAYGLIAGLPMYFFLWLVVCWILISALTVAISALLSIFAMIISIFLKNFGIVKALLFCGIVGVAIWGIVTIINLIPENFSIIGSWGTLFWRIQDFLTNFTTNFKPFTLLTQLVIGGYVGLRPRLFSINTIWILLSVLGVILLCLLLSFVITKPLFFRMASKPFEYRKVNVDKKIKNRKVSPFLSSINLQVKNILRSSDELYPLLGTAVALPILILLLNRLYAAMSTDALGSYMTSSFNLLIILLISLATNNKLASIYSREGSASQLVKTRPNEYGHSLLAKIIPHIVVMTISISVSVYIFQLFNEISTVNTILFGVCLVVIYIAHALWSAEMDIMNPQYAQYSSTGAHINNPNETKSSVIMFILSFIFFVVSLFLSAENIEVSWIKTACVALALLVFRIWSYTNKIEIYYKEK